MSAYTPGPWCVGATCRSMPEGQYPEIPVRVGSWGANGGPGNALAMVYMGGPGATSTQEADLEANARLIAQAPALVEALQGLLRADAEIRTLPGPGLSLPVSLGDLCRARAVLAAVQAQEVPRG